MSNIIYFQSQRQSLEDKMILKLVPKNKTESSKADIAEKILTPKQYIKYLAFVITYHAYDLVAEQHQDFIKNLINIGVFDEIAVLVRTGLTNSCVTNKGEFLYNDIEFKLPKGYTPRLRCIDADNNIYVEAFNKEGKSRVYKFVHYESGKNHTWERVYENDYLVDF